MSTAPLDWLLSPAAIDTGLDRKMLAGLLLELARNVDPNVGTEPTGIAPFDPRLEQLRFLLLGREIELSRHFSEVLDDPERLATVISRVLPAAIAQAAARDERLGQVLAPALGSSVRRDPDTLVDILHPLIGPAIGKSIELDASVGQRVAEAQPFLARGEVALGSVAHRIIVCRGRAQAYLGLSG